MEFFNWADDKNEQLKQTRNISFEEIVLLIHAGKLLGIEHNPAYPQQKLYIVNVNEYAVVVPFVESETEIFLKTAFPSRKKTNQYGLKGQS